MTLSRHQDKPQQLWRHLEVPLQYLAMSKSIFLIVSVTIVLALVSFPCSKCPPCPDAVLQGQLSHLLKAIRKATRWLSWYGVGLASADRLPVVVRIPAGPLGSLKCDPPKGNGRRPKKKYSKPFEACNSAFDIRIVQVDSFTECIDQRQSPGVISKCSK